MTLVTMFDTRLSARAQTARQNGHRYFLTGGHHSNRYVFDITTGAGGMVRFTTAHMNRAGVIPGLCGGIGFAMGSVRERRRRGAPTWHRSKAHKTQSLDTLPNRPEHSFYVRAALACVVLGRRPPRILRTRRGLLLCWSWCAHARRSDLCSGVPLTGPIGAALG
jgi:hypothetical protein